MQGRKPHFRALQACPLTVGEGEASFCLPPVRRTQNNVFNYRFRLAAHEIRLLEAQPKRMDRVEQIAGRVGRTGKTAVVSIVRHDGVDRGFGERNGDAELGMRSARKAIKAVYGLQQPLFGGLLSPQSGRTIDMGRQPAKEDFLPLLLLK